MVSMVAIWITSGKYSKDVVPVVIPSGDFSIQWSGQTSGNLDYKVGRGTFVFYRARDNTPFTYLGRVKSKRVISECILRKDAAIYELVISTGKSTGRVFQQLADETGAGCFKRSVLRTLGWSYDHIFHMQGISQHHFD